MPRGPEQAALAAYYEKQQAEGLVDVRFYLSNGRETTTEQACRELNRMHEAFARGEYFEKEFNDSRRA